MTLESALINELANAEMYFIDRYKGRLEKRGSDTLFPRWIAHNYKMQIMFAVLPVYPYSNAINWKMLSYSDEELLTMFKLQFG